MKLPLQYLWLNKETGPRMLLEALKLYGTLEVPGPGDNPKILTWAQELKLEAYSHDAIPWCGLFMALIAKRAFKKLPDSPLWALSWISFGVASPVPMLGDVLVYRRDGGGHVNLYVGEDTEAYHGIGGNQGDRVDIIRIAKDRLYRARRPIYINQPENIRVVILAPSGVLSTNEA